jgi:hypothetical protein
MTTHTLYAGPAGPAGTGRLVITARPAFHAYSSPVWLVSFQRWGKAGGKMLDRTAAWLPEIDYWDETRWFPGSPLVPLAVLADVEAWLRGRPVGELETTTAPRPT